MRVEKALKTANEVETRLAVRKDCLRSNMLSKRTGRKEGAARRESLQHSGGWYYGMVVKRETV